MKDFKTEYISMLNSGNMNLQFFFDYYYSHCKDCLDKRQFQDYFGIYFNRHSQQIQEYLCKKLGVNKIYNKNNELIRYI